MVCVIQLFLTVSIVTLKEQLNFPTGPSFAPPPFWGLIVSFFLAIGLFIFLMKSIQREAP